jgi:hypothetical protein
MRKAAFIFSLGLLLLFTAVPSQAAGHGGGGGGHGGFGSPSGLQGGSGGRGSFGGHPEFHGGFGGHEFGHGHHDHHFRGPVLFWDPWYAPYYGHPPEQYWYCPSADAYYPDVYACSQWEVAPPPL